MTNTAIHEKLTAFYTAFNTKSWEALAACLSDDFSYFTDNGKVQNKAAFLAFMQADDWQGESFELKDLSISKAKSEDLAVATYRTSFGGSFGGTSMQFSAMETAVFKAEAGEWKLLHLHVSNKT
ncbi:MAG: nuclear transport factor 2 family protein [Bacteroidota bacterium]